MAPLALTPTMVTVDRAKFTLEVWKLRGRRYRRTHRLPIAVGVEGSATPRGVYFVESKSRTPAWKPPAWAGHPEGTVFEFEDERNPFSAGFISLAESDGVGIHGVKFDAKLGTRASHGCIRMADGDLLAIYERIPLGAPVFIY